MATPPSPPHAKKPPQRRSRNGCNECRRLHRRCDEAKPECHNCLTDGKTCSYQRTLTWIDRPTTVAKRGPRASQRPTPSPSSSSLVPSSPLPSSSSSPFLLPPVQIPVPPTWLLPWLSPRHRQLVSHFAHVTCASCFLEPRSHHALCAVLLPLATDSTHGFPLLAAMLSVALTQRGILGGSDAGFAGTVATEREAAYWEALAVGHLRRFRVGDGGGMGRGRGRGRLEGAKGGVGEGDEDEDAENLFAATALLLSHRESFRGGERVRSWRAHLDGAMVVLRRGKGGTTREELRRLGVAMQKVASVFVHPGWKKGGGARAVTDGGEERCESLAHFVTCDRLDMGLGVSHAFMHTLVDVEGVAADMTALLHMERAAGAEGMGPLWEALWRRVETMVTASEHMCGNLLKTDESELRELGVDGTDLEQVAYLNRTYYFITLSQIHLHLMGHNTVSDVVQQGLKNAMDCLDKLEIRDRACPAVALVQPCFAIGSYARSDELRNRVVDRLSDAKKRYGRGNAQKVTEFLVELWQRQDAEGEDAMPPVSKLDWRLNSRTPHRGEEYEWTDLMAEKNWDLSLW